ncbi:MAG: sulfoxide reductase heme-binding subunit YedZ, partial [Gammaproteobacteria bacterium]|nr:sulfoxide reductase heme-binding subunit YedZ [Gammaproteobacteria bacterium]
AVLGTLHFLLLVKADLREPIIYIVILMLLFILRSARLRNRVLRFAHQ